jgi:hypothetical protein
VNSTGAPSGTAIPLLSVTTAPMTLLKVPSPLSLRCSAVTSSLRKAAGAPRTLIDAVAGGRARLHDDANRVKRVGGSDDKRRPRLPGWWRSAHPPLLLLIVNGGAPPVTVNDCEPPSHARPDADSDACAGTITGSAGTGVSP